MATALLIFLQSALPGAESPIPFSTRSRLSNGDIRIQPPEPVPAQVQAAPGLKAELFATEKLVNEPVSLTFDHRGRLLVAESHRWRNSVFDIRDHPVWLDADLSFRKVEDRANFFKKVLAPENKALTAGFLRDWNGDGQLDDRDLEVESERIRWLEDTDGDGQADRAGIYAEDFRTVLSGAAGGILACGGSVWFACVPDLWLLRDADFDGQADSRKSVLQGFGVHIARRGHDLHGLRRGPDGKLYFCMGDRGLNVRAGNRSLALPDSGAVLRCNPDGSGLEIFASGLRHPRDLAFDQLGNLWTGDGAGEAGDKGRWLYVVEGSDFGWQIGWQSLPELGVWSAEKLWELAEANTAAYVLPPVAHIGLAPAGLAFYPGTGLPTQYDGHFLMCESRVGIQTFTVRPKGAAYEVANLRPFLSELDPVDVEFGPDGALYVASRTDGLDKAGQGRVYRVYDPNLMRDAAVRDTRRLLAEGMANRSLRELMRLLEHKDQRVRLEAQFALAEKGVEATNRLVAVALKHENPLTRLHAIWALGQMGRSLPPVFPCLVPLLSDPMAEVRTQAAKVLGDARRQEAYEALVRALQDPHPRVRFFAALGVGKLGYQEATEPIFLMLREHAGDDPFLRHAGVMALAWLNDINALVAAARDSSARVRMASLLAMRRLGRPEIAMFLYDSDLTLVLEAARAIYDLPILSAFSQLASLIAKPGIPDAVMRRVLYASCRLGNLENALALAEFAAHQERPEALRAEALHLLGQWSQPMMRDPVLGSWRPQAPRDNRGANLALRSELPNILRTGTDSLRMAAAQLAAQLEMRQAGPILFGLFSDPSLSPNVRFEALQALVTLKDPRLMDAVMLGLRDNSELVRKEAGHLLSLLKPSDAISQVAAALERGALPEKQRALDTLASLENPVADQIILAWLDLLQSGQVPQELQLDLLDAAARRSAPTVKNRLELYEATRAKADPLTRFRECLFGGDAAAGKTIFFERAETRCARCHKVNGQGGEQGPDLTGIGFRQSRESLLESILFPNQTIAPGHENVLVTMKNGTRFAGRWRNETEGELLLNSPEDGLVVVSKSQIETREKRPSSMPTDLGQRLLKRELRNLVEYLASLK